MPNCESNGDALLTLVEEAATARYQELAVENPVLHDVSVETSEEVAGGFKEIMGPEFSQHADSLKSGLYRIYMDFTDKGPRENDEPIDMIHMKSVVGAFILLMRIYERDWGRVAEEFRLLTASMEIASEDEDVPDFDRHDTRFGFLFAMTLERGTVTGLRRQ